MAPLVGILLVCILCVNLYNADDLQVGTSVNMQLAYSENVKLSAIIFTTRTKNVFYSTDNTSKVIKGVSAIDLDKSNAKAVISAGGVGFTFVNVKIESQRGDGLNYYVQIFV